MKKSEHERKQLLRKIESAYNKGFREMEYEEAYKDAGFIELKNKKVLVASEIKEQLSTLIDGMVKGEVEHISFNIKYRDRMDLAIRVRGQTQLYDLRLGSESTTNKS